MIDVIDTTIDEVMIVMGMVMDVVIDMMIAVDMVIVIVEMGGMIVEMGGMIVEEAGMIAPATPVLILTDYKGVRRAEILPETKHWKKNISEILRPINLPASILKNTMIFQSIYMEKMCQMASNFSKMSI